jgi:hypothetical protein
LIAIHAYFTVITGYFGNYFAEPQYRLRAGFMRPSSWLTLVFLGFMTTTAWADILFDCQNQAGRLQPDVTAYLRALRIPSEQITYSRDQNNGNLMVTLATSKNDTQTLDFSIRSTFALSQELVYLPSRTGRAHPVSTVSRKEILLALLQHGRTTTLTDAKCTIESLVDLVGVRQNIVAWAQELHWGWPDGGYAQWNQKYWIRGTPKQGVPLRKALLNAFLQQEKYSIGCYTAAKLLLVHSVLDYYSRIKSDPIAGQRVEAALLADGEPLVGVEPGTMWKFEKEYLSSSEMQPGKLMTLDAGVAADNFVPGDWIYLLNTDSKSYQRIGYEGSNAIYLGSNRFGDFYNDHRHSYSYQEKILEVYQWRHGVFNRSRDAAKIEVLTDEQLIGLSRTPNDGGLQLDFRASPRLF